MKLLLTRPVITRPAAPALARPIMVQRPTIARLAPPAITPRAAPVAPVFARPPDPSGDTAQACANAWIVAHSGEEGIATLTLLAQALGNVYRKTGAADYARKFKLPGEFISPWPALTEWAAATWGNFYWLGEIVATFAINFHGRNPLAEKMLYLRYTPPDVKGSSIPDFSSCPLFDKAQS